MSKENKDLKGVLKALLDQRDFEFSDDPDTEEQEIENMISTIRRKVDGMIKRLKSSYKV